MRGPCMPQRWARPIFQHYLSAPWMFFSAVSTTAAAPRTRPKAPFQLRGMLDRARDQGYAVDRDETFVGLSCVAVPVIVNGSTLVGAAGITGLTHRSPPIG